jgi:hypothetical protein
MEMTARVIAGAAAMLVVSAGLSSAQLLPQQQGAKAAPAVEGRGESRNQPARTLTCVDVLVRANSTNAGGVEWDDWAGREAPEILVSETTTGADTKCTDTMTCTIRIHPVSGVLSFSLYDSDWPDSDDFIGAGSCTVGETCTLGLARVSMNAC